MSSNIEVTRICQYCNKEFKARTTKTRYCSHKCNSAHYKAKKRNKNIVESNVEVKRKKDLSIEELKAKEFLTVTEVSKLIGCSRQNIYKLINSGKLKATNILEKKTIVQRCDIDLFFEEVRKSKEAKPLSINIDDCYFLKEILEKYSISEKALYELILRNEIPKVRKGKYTYVPKKMIDNLLK